ncbi:hypothetical protein OROMI_005724 [Orobanche minor]
MQRKRLWEGEAVSSNSTFGYECECDSGWKQAGSQDDEYLKFLPCVIPNSCFWTYCGGGSCNKMSIFSHTLVKVRRVTTICLIQLLSHATKNAHLRHASGTRCAGKSVGRLLGLMAGDSSHAHACLLGSLGVPVEVLSCDLEDMGSNPVSRLLQKCMSAFGLDCASLGLGINNSTTLRPDTSPSSADESKCHE